MSLLDEARSELSQKTLKEIERYTEAANQARLARSAMARLPENNTTLESV